MRTVQTDVRFPLASVKPLKQLATYREACLALTRQALEESCRRREVSPIAGTLLESWGQVDSMEYLRDPQTGSLFLAPLPDWKRWGRLLKEVSRLRNSPEGFHRELASSRAESVYLPRLEWIQEALRLSGIVRPLLLEAQTSPSGFSQILEERDLFPQILTVDEMELAHGSGESPLKKVQAALLMESLDRVDEPKGLLQGVARRLTQGGLLFVTGLVSSGFDMAVLGARNLYLYPPDRANCFSLQGLKQLLERGGFTLLEVSTPGVLDVEIVQAHLQADPSLPLSDFERQMMGADQETRAEFQDFLQRRGLSSFARIVARRA